MLVLAVMGAGNYKRAIGSLAVSKCSVAVVRSMESMAPTVIRDRSSNSGHHTTLLVPSHGTRDDGSVRIHPVSSGEESPTLRIRINQQGLRQEPSMIIAQYIAQYNCATDDLGPWYW